MKVSRSLYQVRAYNVKHNYEVGDFLEAYRLLLQRTMDEIWSNIRWVKKHDKRGRRKLIPIIPKDGYFKHHHLRDLLLKD
ncbi:hypothetical protein KEJ27_01665 [Candidatus Bathyarchaeota archaeon]|nr:hypothetical protein [Candidatus Bathyarchaeota archaeon]MBS7618564.1 hypothetical protein [Candidatus Bathyarchaeota archaeon]